LGCYATPCSLVNIAYVSRECTPSILRVAWLIFQPENGAVRSSEPSANFYQTRRHNLPEKSTLLF
jgi:hypothetical protein